MGQVKQLLEDVPPGVALYVPAGHEVHALGEPNSLSTLSSLYVPAGHV